MAHRTPGRRQRGRRRQAPRPRLPTAAAGPAEGQFCRGRGCCGPTRERFPPFAGWLTRVQCAQQVSWTCRIGLQTRSPVGDGGPPVAGGKKPTLGLGDRPDGRGRGTAPQGSSDLATGRRRGFLRRDRGPSSPPTCANSRAQPATTARPTWSPTQQKNLIRQSQPSRHAEPKPAISGFSTRAFGSVVD
jgi:hypothetical protein